MASNAPEPGVAMSGPFDRRDNRTGANLIRQWEIIDAYTERNRRIAEAMAEAARLHGGRGALEERKYEFWASALEHLHPVPGQPKDTALTDVPIMKRSNQVTHFYGRTSEIIKERWGTQIRVALNCREASASWLRKAFSRVHKVQLRQMRNADLKAAGIVLDAQVSDDGIVDLVGVVTDPVAAEKVSQRAYTGVLISVDPDGDVISDVSLIDSPAAFLAKAGRPAGEVICKIYNGAKDVNKTNHYVLPASAQAVVDEQNCIATLAQRGTDGLILKALQANNNAAYGLELVKMARIAGNRLTGPRFGGR
jgi:hypothetical protein